MNVSSLPAPPRSQLSWTDIKASEKEADFLSLRLLNKRLRIRLSAQPLDSPALDGKGDYFAISNLKGWFAAIARSSQGENLVILSPLTELRSAILESKAEGEESLNPKRSLPILHATPTHLTFSQNDERLVVGCADGSVLIHNTSVLFSPGVGVVEPLRAFPPAGPGPLRQIVGNPGDLPDLVAVRREAENGGDGLIVEILDTRKLQSVGGWRSGGSQDSFPTSIAWSPRGKQLALGMRNGDIVTYSPSDTSNAKQHIPRPPRVGECSIISVLWLANHVFYGVYVPQGNRSPEAPQKHFVTLRDSKSNTATQIELETPYFPSPALRPPSAFPVVMRNWEPAKYLVFFGDSTSSDIGVVGSLSEESSSAETWCNLSLEETSTPSLPLDKDDNDTVPLGLEMDLTYSQHPDSGAPTLPVMYLYASDGTLQAWYVSNEKGGRYSGMALSSASCTSTTSSAPDATIQTANETQNTPSFTPVNPPNTSTFSTTPFGSSTTQPPAFGQPSAPTFGTSGFASLTQTTAPQPEPTKSAFGQKTTFGSPGFASSTPAFGQSSAFGQNNSPAAPAFAQPSGFGAFASQASSKFGGSGFGLGNPSPPAASLAAPADAASPEAEMSEADESSTGGLMGLSLGSNRSAQKAEGVNSMFGSFAQPPSSQTPSTFGSTTNSSIFGSGSTSSNSFGAFGNIEGTNFIKPATGFNAFSGFNKPPESQTGKNQSAEAPKPSPAFGSTGFVGAKPQSTFGQSGFGQPSFGSPAFGKSVFQNSAVTSSLTAGTTSGFSSFASGSKGFGAFAQAAPTGFAQVLQSKPSDTPSISMSSSGDGDKSSTTATETKPSPFSASASGSAFGSTPATSPFGRQRDKTSVSSTDKSSSPFGIPVQSNNTNVFGGGQFLSTPATNFQNNAQSSTTATPMSVAPTVRTHTPDSSPEGSPVAKEKQNVDEADLLTQVSPSEDTKIAASTTGQSSTPFGSPSASSFGVPAAPKSGAFANLTSTPSAFRPAEGFGAFGTAAKVPATSPFANPRGTSASAFGSPVTGFGAGSGSAFSAQTPPKAVSSTPTFGSTSALGGAPTFGKSVFASLAPTTPTTTPTKSTTSAFGAYSGSGGFSAFAGGKSSSFSDLLKSEKDATPKVTGAPSVFTVGSSSAKASEKPEPKTAASNKVGEVGDGPKESSSSEITQAAKNDSSSVAIPQPEDITHDNLPPTPSSHGTFDDEEDEERNHDDEHDDMDSFLSQSFSEGSDADPINDESGEEGGSQEDEEDDSEAEVEKEEEKGEGQDRKRPPKGLEGIGLPSRPLASSSVSRDATPVSRSNRFGTSAQLPSKIDWKTPSTSPDAEKGPEFESATPTPSKPPSNEIVETKSQTHTPQTILGELESPIGGSPASHSLSGKPFSLGQSPKYPSPFPQMPVSQSDVVKGLGPSQASIPSLAKPGPASALESTTPPGSPGKELPAPICSPKPVAAATTTTASSLGLGRPGSRPTKSSPLAATPLSGDEEIKAATSSSQPGPSLEKPRPASPKLPFGHSSGTIKLEPATPTLSRLSTPENANPSKALPPFAVPSSLSQQLKVDVLPLAPSAPGAFKFPSAPPLSSPSPPALGGNAPFIMPNTQHGMSPLPSSGPLFGTTKTGTLPSGILFGAKQQTSPQIAKTSQPQPQMQMQTTSQSGMQAELQALYATMTKELDDLRRLGQDAAAFQNRLGSPSVTVHTKADLGDKLKWTFGDLHSFDKALRNVEKDLLAWYAKKDEFLTAMQEVESNLLKAETRKEEIVRFSKAKADPGFAKMLKSRTLGPDAAETQTQLRKQVRLINDRVEQLESHLSACKKKVEERRKGRPSIKPPSLDTINRTYRNIDLAIGLQAQQIVELTARVAKLNVGALGSLDGSPSSVRSRHSIGGPPSTSDGEIKRTGQTRLRREVTPSVAASTAAALNAERSALRLKNALARARKSPLLNTQAVEPVSRAPTLDALQTPPRAGLQSSGCNAPVTIPAWSSSLDPGPESLSDSGPSTNTQRQTYGRPTRHAAHAKAVPLGKTHAKVPSEIKSFDWGPLPGAKPMTNLPFDVRPEVVRKSS